MQPNPTADTVPSRPNRRRRMPHPLGNRPAIAPGLGPSRGRVKLSRAALEGCTASGSGYVYERLSQVDRFGVLSKNFRQSRLDSKASLGKTCYRFGSMMIAGAPKGTIFG